MIDTAKSEAREEEEGEAREAADFGAGVVHPRSSTPISIMEYKLVVVGGEPFSLGRVCRNSLFCLTGFSPDVRGNVLSMSHLTIENIIETLSQIR